MDGTQVAAASPDPVADGCTERFDSIARVDDRFRRASRGLEPGRVEPDSPGCHIEIQGPNLCNGDSIMLGRVTLRYLDV